MSTGERFARLVDGDGKTVVEFIGPGKSNDGLSIALRVLTHQLHTKGLGEKSGGFFGGEFGDGVPFENDVFMMHPYCWCEKSECQWCRCCECPHAYFLDGQPCTHRQYEDHCWSEDAPRYDAPKALHDAWWDRVRSERIEPKCAACASGEDRRPHFHHKPSGLTVRWYKYIGRDMDVDVPNAIGLADMLNACLASIGAPCLDIAVQEYEAAEEAAAKAMREGMERMANAMRSPEFHKIMDSAKVSWADLADRTKE